MLLNDGIKNSLYIYIIRNNDKNDGERILAKRIYDNLVNTTNDDSNLNTNTNNNENCDSSFEYEVEADYLQFAEDSLDIDEIVKAAEVEIRETESCFLNNIEDIYENNTEIADQLDFLTDEISED